jgi:hypothetical protein
MFLDLPLHRIATELFEILLLKLLFREHSGNIQGTFSQQSGNIQ